MNLTKKTKKIGTVLGVIATVLLILSLLLPGMLETSVAEPIFPEDHLFVDALYLVKTEETNTTVNATCTPYLTNIWEKDSGEIKIIVYVVERKNNMAICKNAVEIGKIAASTTAEIELPITFEEGSYKVDLLIFEDDRIVLKGGLSITTKQDPHYITLNGVKAQWTIDNDGFDVVSVK